MKSLGPSLLFENMKTFVAFMLCMLSTLTASAQTGAPNWLEDSLYASGKMNTVAVVVGIILLGIGIWLFTLDRKLKKLEEKIEKPMR